MQRVCDSRRVCFPCHYEVAGRVCIHVGILVTFSTEGTFVGGERGGEALLRGLCTVWCQKRKVKLKSIGPLKFNEHEHIPSPRHAFENPKVFSLALHV